LASPTRVGHRRRGYDADAAGGREDRILPARWLQEGQGSQAIGEEHGYWLRVAELTVLDVSTPDFAVTVFPLGHDEIDGLVGMNFLRHFNVEIRPEERLIHLELIKR